MPDDLDELTGGLRRMWSTARLTTKLGAKAAKRLAFRPKQKDDDSASEAALASAHALVARMGQLKGLVMKAGQIASYMPGSMPPAVQEVLAQLQASSTPMSFHRIDEQLRAELGRPGRELFESFEEQPFAAASIGQVHRAVHEGRQVAVKVQYPGVEDVIRSDLKMVAVMVRLSMVGSRVDGGALAGELRDRLLEECDYTLEAKHQQLFATLVAGIDGASVPGVIAARSSRRVLTTALVTAKPLAEIADQSARDRAGAIIFRTCFELLFRRCIYNADPHPGNYLLGPAGEVTFLDFGCVRRFDPQMIVTWKAMARSILTGDRDAFVTSYRALGFVGKEKGFDWDYQWEALRFLYKPYLEPSYRYDADIVAKTFGVLMFDNPNRFRMAMPPEWLFLNRLQWGLNAVLAQLHANARWRDILDDVLAAPLDPA